ncbi:sigma-70 family RNA polymerase sigma factor [Motilibacter deserti]|uniref:Sigma-70 family RNA polymerase sigma factor n=1 Tax=Motilibacter deserti TaxID=2714956 RepID=A0ABX0H103_9ACTN|nr:sigma-70 family RNA polymerase sigma factor [Motilibacter deserti]NHC15571.1 sigma-70 family RNA polymerase sigma factor [Motilibacter deserti]
MPMPVLARSQADVVAEVTARLLSAAAAGAAPTLSALRTEFAGAGLSPEEGRTVLSALAAAGVTLAAADSKPAAKPRARRTTTAKPKAAPAVRRTADKVATPAVTDPAPVEAPAPAEPAPAQPVAEVAASATAAVPAQRSSSTAKSKAEGTEATADTDLVKVYLREIGRVPLLDAATEVELSQQIEAGLFAEQLLMRVDTEGEAFLADMAGAPTVRELRELARTGVSAKARMVEANLRLAVSVAKKYQNRGVDLLDLIQESSLGLIRAVEKFDWKTGYKFSTYAMWWLRQSTQRGLAEQARTVRLPVHVVEQLSKLARVRRELTASLGEAPTEAQLAEALGMPEAKVIELLDVSRDVLSLEAPLGDGTDDGTLGDILADAQAPDAHEQVAFGLLQDELAQVLSQLPEREQTIMRMRFGLETGREHTLLEIGDRLGLTRERVRQLEKESLRRLRTCSGVSDLLEYVA